MSHSHNSDEIIQEALSLDGTINKLQNFYAKWASNYDSDVATEAYTAPNICVDLLKTYSSSLLSHTTDLSLLDAGCGTGLIGHVLQSEVDLFQYQIDGFDLSQEMIEQAKLTNAYRNLASNINLNQPLNHLEGKQYNAVFCCGVFTLGHVPPHSLKNLFNATLPDGLVITSTRTRYYEESDYQAVNDQFIAQNVVSLVKVLKDAPYTSDDNSHYWVYKVM
ncbi:MAG: class I SAM-dependent methyltransferase [Chloroflexota bacterium]